MYYRAVNSIVYSVTWIYLVPDLPGPPGGQEVQYWPLNTLIISGLT